MPAPRQPVLLYVVLRHSGFGEEHYDLMLELESGSKLSTWRLPNWPPREGDHFTPLADHRRDYLEYEGSISGNRGSVKRVAAGHHQIVENKPERILIRLESGVTLAIQK
jgi:hypothetical protein